MNFDLESLRLLWWLLLGLFATGLAVAEGVSLGVLMLTAWVGNSPESRSRLLGSIAPLGSIGLAWLAAVVVVLFAAWPIAYAVALSSMQSLILALLLALLPRPLALGFYSTSIHPLWQAYRDKLLLAGGWVPAVVYGLLAGNLLKGIPFHLESDMRIAFLGDVMSLLNPFTLLVAACCVALLLMHGASYAVLKFAGSLNQPLRWLQLRAGIAFVVLFALAGLWVSHLEGYHINSEILTNAGSNPLSKFVKRGEGLWLDNYEHLPWLAAIPVLAFLGAIGAMWLTALNRPYYAMLCSSIAVTTTLWTGYVSMFPFLLPSNLSLNSSLTLWDSSAGLLPLQSLLPLAVSGLLVMSLMTRWVFWLFSARIAEREEDAMPGDDGESPLT